MDIKPCLGKIENGKHYFPVRVYYNHTDAGGIMYYANYFRIAEEARVALFDVMAHDDLKSYNDIKLLGDFVVRTANAEYYKSAHYEDEITIITEIEKFSPVRIKFKYTLYNQFGDLINIGTTMHGWTNNNLKIINLKKLYPNIYSRIENCCS